MKSSCIALCLALAGLVASSAAVGGGPEIQTEDVSRFFSVYDAAGGRPTVAQLQRDYLEAGSNGLRTFARLRNTTPQRIADAIARQPQLFVQARRCADVLPLAAPRLALALDKLREIYPAAKLPPVTIAIGRGKPIGVGSPDTGLQIGLEAMCGVTFMAANLEDRFVHVAAHEYVHVQQPAEVVDHPNPTVLEGSLMEGAAEFIGELISGGVSFAGHAATVRGSEAAIEKAFASDVDKRDVSGWLYNGSLEQEGNLGYWVGYRIAKSYYVHAQDKRAAVREIIEMRDAKAFLARSGWYPGIAL